MAKHLFPTGTGVTATQPVSRSPGIPSVAPSKSDISLSSVISSNSAYMHLSAHLLLGFNDCTPGLLLALVFRFDFPFFLVLENDNGKASCIGSAPGSVGLTCATFDPDASVGAADWGDSREANWATPSRTGSFASSSSSSDGPKFKSAKKSSWREESKRSARL